MTNDEWKAEAMRLVDALEGAIDAPLEVRQGRSVWMANRLAARAALLAHLETRPEGEGEIEAMRADKDSAYEERNKVVAALARLFPSGIARTATEGWSDDWHGCVYIDLPTGQVSWHFHDSQAHLFYGLPPYTKGWDGHDTEEKYARLARLGLSQNECEGKDPRGCWNVRCQLGNVCCRASPPSVPHADALDARLSDEELLDYAATLVALADAMVTASFRDRILRQIRLLPDARNALIDYLLEIEPYKPSGNCTCAGPDAPCADCESNEEGYREWMTECLELRAPILARAEAIAKAAPAAKGQA